MRQVETSPSDFADLRRHGCIAVVLLSLALAALSADASNAAAESAPFFGERKWIAARAYADVRTAYISRGAVSDSRPFSAQFANVDFLAGGFGRLGGNVWCASAFSGKGCSSYSHRAFNEVDYDLHCAYDLELTDDWSLESRLAHQWILLPGYEGDPSTRDEWIAAQTLANPFATPYWYVRRAYDPVQWAYWRVGLKRHFPLAEGLSFSADAYGELGDARHLRSKYGAKPNEPDSRYRGGLQALSLVLRLDYKLREHLGVYASVQQFGIVNEDARGAVKASSKPSAKRDLTVGCIGLAADF